VIRQFRGDKLDITD